MMNITIFWNYIHNVNICVCIQGIQVINVSFGAFDPLH